MYKRQVGCVWIEGHKPDVVMIDGVYMMRMDNRSSFDLTWTNIAAIFNELRQMSLGYNIPIFGVTQLGRATNEMDPDVTDLSYADFIGQVATVALLLSHPSNWLPSYRQLKIAKNRDGDTPLHPLRLKVDFDKIIIHEDTPTKHTQHLSLIHI